VSSWYERGVSDPVPISGEDGTGVAFSSHRRLGGTVDTSMAIDDRGHYRYVRCILEAAGCAWSAARLTSVLVLDHAILGFVDIAPNPNYHDAMIATALVADGDPSAWPPFRLRAPLVFAKDVVDRQSIVAVRRGDFCNLYWRERDPRRRGARILMGKQLPTPTLAEYATRLE
jgi:hypothetical protein